jgi:hypothetical protein
MMAVFSTTLFAAPLSAAGSLQGFSREISLAEQSSAATGEFDDLFAGVQAAVLTSEEAEAVEGEGFWGSIFGAVAAAVTVGICVVDLVQGNTETASQHLAGGMAVAGGLVALVP